MDEEVFVIPPSEMRMYRVMFEGGRTMDVQAAHREGVEPLNSKQRKEVLDEAYRRWGGERGTVTKVGTWRICAVTEIQPDPTTKEA